MARLAGKVAIVTGGAKGIGRHYSQALAAEGARVMIADIEDGARSRRRSSRNAMAPESAASAIVRCQRRAGGGAAGARDDRALRPDRRAGQQRRALFQADAAQLQRMGRRIVGPRDGDQRARALSDGAPRRAAHDRAQDRQDHQHRLGRGLQRRAAHAALRHLEGRHAGLHPRAVARARRHTASRSIRCRPAISCPTPGSKTPPMSRRSARRCAIRAPSSATPIRRTCSARWCSWPRATAISSPASRWWWTAARSIIS